MHMDISEEPVYARIYNENALDQDLDKPAGVDFVRACGDISEEPVYARIYPPRSRNSEEPIYIRIYRKMPRPRWSTLI